MIQARLAVPLAALALLGVLSQAATDIVLINESPSLPKGLYLLVRRDSPTVGDVVAFDQNATARSYLHALGTPSDLPLLKRVAAVAGDEVCAGAKAVRIVQRQAPTRRRDHRGMTLPQWRGCSRLRPDELFLLGDGPDSFDSRYFGPMTTSHVRGIYRELLTW